MQNRSKYLQIFSTDSQKMLGEMHHLVHCLEHDRGNHDLINDLFRKAHSLKGMAGTMELTRLTELSHSLEEPLSDIRSGKSALSPTAIDLLFEGVGLLEGLVEEAMSGAPEEIDYRDFLARLSNAFNSDQPAPYQKERRTYTYHLPKTISVSTEILDHLVNNVGELMIQRNRLAVLGRMHRSYEFDEELQQLSRIIQDLYHRIVTIKMMPVATVTDFLYRLVRDLAVTQGKEITVALEGEREIFLDRTILEELVDPLIHLVRNAVDHGIETPSVRSRRGKGAGTILLRFSKEQDLATIEVIDDGNGIDPEIIKDRAIEKGIITAAGAVGLDRDDALMLLCKPGFSTAEKITDVSGRGVGLDVVYSTVETLGGTFSITSQPGKGTTFTVTVPTTTHIFFALLVELQSHVFALPLTRVLGTAAVKPSRETSVITFHHDDIPLMGLHELLGSEPPPAYRDYSHPVVVVDTAGEKRGVVVDKLIGIEQIFEKPIGPPLNTIEGVSGVTILGNQGIALVLDLGRLHGGNTPA